MHYSESFLACVCLMRNFERERESGRARERKGSSAETLSKTIYRFKVLRIRNLILFFFFLFCPRGAPQATKHSRLPLFSAFPLLLLFLFHFFVLKVQIQVEMREIAALRETTRQICHWHLQCKFPFVRVRVYPLLTLQEIT